MRYEIIDQFIARELREKREESGYTIADICSITGLKKTTYHNYETAKRSMPMDVYKKLCTLYHIDCIKLLEDAQKEMIEEITRSR